ncbi:MAG TPA: guanylate kinase [Candidatus Faecousia intestinigallinarum]|nr:guanylate kinase [Candidatus Faecousia intestinigallinarum]
MSKGKLFAISGASGVGKSTVLAKVMAARKDLRFSVSATTRPPRPGEAEGVNYFFVTREKFEDMIAHGAFLEYDAHEGNYYGTPLAQLEEKQKKSHVILDIEPNGAFNLRRKMPDAVLIFIMPPSREELERRLRSRGDTSEEQIAMRLHRAQWEMDQSVHYDYVVVNDQVDACADEILRIIAEKAQDLDGGI